MTLLKRNYWWFWLLLNIITSSISNLFLGKILKVYEKNAWYTKWYYWVLGIMFGIFPALIMLSILIIEVTVKISVKLEVPGQKIYALPYPWLIAFIIPIIGWTIFIIMLIYINIMYIIKLFQRKGEQYIIKKK